MVVGLAVIPYQLQIIQHLLHPFVTIVLQLPSNTPQIHRLLDEQGVVTQSQSYITHLLPYQSTGVLNYAESGLSISICRMVFIFRNYSFSSGVVEARFREELRLINR